MDTDTKRRLLSVPEAAARLNVRPRRVYELIAEGKLPGVVRIGRQVRIDPVALDHWIAAGGWRLPTDAPRSTRRWP